MNKTEPGAARIAEHPEAPETIKAVVAARGKARKAALKAKGAKPKAKPKAAAKGKAKGKATPAANTVQVGARGLTAVPMRKGSKQAAMYGALLKPEGATADELVKVTGFTRSTMMGAIHGGRIKKFLKLMGGKLATIDKEGEARRYRIVAK